MRHRIRWKRTTRSGQERVCSTLSAAAGGTTPDHITHMQHAVEGVKPRTLVSAARLIARLEAAGLEPFTAAA